MGCIPPPPPLIPSAGPSKPRPRKVGDLVDDSKNMGVAYNMEACWVCKRTKSQQTGQYICDDCTLLGWVVKNEPWPTNFFKQLVYTPYHRIKLEHLLKSS